MGKTILEAVVKEAKKCRYPSKYYIYVLEVTWSEGSTTLIYRRYSDFFEFQCGLLEKFPEEAGAKDPSTRVIPFLPGKKLLGRSQVRSVAEKRKDKLNDYCKALVRMPSKLSDDEFVLNFFELRPEDLENPTKTEKRKTTKTSSSNDIQEISEPLLLERYVSIADYSKQKKNECSLRAGQMVEVIDKNQNGWWFVSLDDYHEGWVPATFLEPLYGQEEAQAEEFAPGEEQYVTTSGYHAQNPDELSFERGVIVDVCMKGLDGWWKVRYKDREGMAPAAYLTRYTGPLSEASNPTQLVGSAMEAIQQTSGQQKSPKPFSRAMLKQTNYEDKEPIYAPTPRKMSVKKQIKRRPPPPSPFGSSSSSSSSPSFSPATNKTPTSPSTPSLPPLMVDGPEPLYEVIPEPEEEVYVTIADFLSSNTGDGLSFSAGSVVTVVTKNASGWWFVEMGDKEGWVPSSYLEKKRMPPPSPKSPTAPALPAKRQTTQSNAAHKSAVRRSASEDSLSSAGGKLAPPIPRPSLSPQVKPRGIPAKKVSSQPILSSALRKSSAPAVTPFVPKTLNKSTSQEETTVASARKSVGKTPAARTTSGGGRPQTVLRTGPLSKSLEAPKPHATSLSSGARDRDNDKAEQPTTASKSVAELAKVLQQKKTQSSTASDSRPTPPKPYTRPSPTSTPSAPSKLHPAPRPKPYSTTPKPISSSPKLVSATPKSLSATAKRTPPRKPEPPKSNTISSTARKAGPPRPGNAPTPPRPANSPALKRKPSYIVACDYDGGTDVGLSLKEGQEVEVLEKNNDGWWYVKLGTKEGWAPSSFLEPSDNKPKPLRPAAGPSRPTTQPKAPVSNSSTFSRPVPKPRSGTISHASPSSNLYRAAASYKVPVYDDSGINLVAGKMYEVMEKADGWWYVKDGMVEGWAPATYLDPA